VDHAVAVDNDLAERDAAWPARILARVEIESLGQDQRAFSFVHAAEVHPPSAGAVAQQQCFGAGASTTDRVGLHADVDHVGRAVVPRCHDRCRAVRLDARVAQLDDRPRDQTRLGIGDDPLVETSEVTVLDRHSVTSQVPTVAELQADPLGVLKMRVADPALAGRHAKGVGHQDPVLEADDARPLDAQRPVCPPSARTPQPLDRPLEFSVRSATMKLSGSGTSVIPSPVLGV